MKQKFLCAFLLATSGISQSANVSAPEPERAIWIWEKDSYAMLEDRSAADDAIRFLNSKHINTIYLYADTFDKQNLIVSQPQMYSRLIQRLHQGGIHTYALLGSAYLHTEEYILPEHRSAALSMMQRVLDFNSRAAPDERFDGVNLDIEPHILDLWPAQKIQLLEWFLDMSQSLMELKKASGQTLSVGPAIPFWLDSIELEWHGQTKRVSDHVQDIYDYVALMDYRDHAEGTDGIISHAKDELIYAGLHNRKVMIGLEVTPNDIQKVSFNHLTEQDMERELSLAEKGFADQPGFAGFVIHHYRGYRTWLVKNTP
jgi:hypothetical protein